MRWGCNQMAYLSVASPALQSRRERTRSGRLRHLLSARDLTIDDVDDFCQAADDFESGLAPRQQLFGRTVALLFFQSSTRTRLGFESAAVGLGAHCIGMEDMSASRTNASIGETIEDCAAVVSRLADAIVVRHHECSAAARMAATSIVPVINAGDGWNEHPTQALIDVHAMRRGLGTLRGKSIAFGGDPRGRVVRSLIQLLRFEGPREIVFCPPPHYEVPEDLVSALAEHQIRLRIIADIDTALVECDAVMMAPYDMSAIGEPPASDYVSPHFTPKHFAITAEKIERLGSKALLYHPLPRFDEIDPSCDSLPNAMYFEQVRLSKFMRMAVLERLLNAN
jgi:aspartate carbamoyltransferase catalytic subunit